MKSLYVFSLLLIFSACSGKPSGNKDEEQTPKRTFQMIEVPSMITEPDLRANYLSVHYWDKFDFKDTAYIHLPEVTEQAFTNFIDILKYASPDAAASAIKGMMSKAEADSTMFAYIIGLYEKYLYEPNSPMRNEELYIPVLETIIASSSYDDVNKIRPQHLLELALKNRVGEPANDFTYTLANGKTGTLYGIKSDYLLLFFYNPDCHACKEVTDQLTGSATIKKLEKSGKLKILAVYPDEDLTAWKAHLPNKPANWINSHDNSLSLKNEEIYDLKAIPTLYLLSKDKKVLLKDVTYQQLEQYLSEQAQ